MWSLGARQFDRWATDEEQLLDSRLPPGATQMDGVEEDINLQQITNAVRSHSMGACLQTSLVPGKVGRLYHGLHDRVPQSPIRLMRDQ